MGIRKDQQTKQLMVNGLLENIRRCEIIAQRESKGRITFWGATEGSAKLEPTTWQSGKHLKAVKTCTQDRTKNGKHAHTHCTQKHALKSIGSETKGMIKRQYIRTRNQPSKTMVKTMRSR
jgi:hypothetical protein